MAKVKYTIKELIHSEGEFVTYFMKKDFPLVYKVKSSNVCVAELESHFGLRGMRGDRELPKYILNNMKPD